LLGLGCCGMLCVVATYRESPAGEPRRTRIPRCSATVGPVGPLHPAAPALLPRALRGPLRFGDTSGREGSLGTPPCGGLEREAETLWSSRRRFTRRARVVRVKEPGELLRAGFARLATAGALLLLGQHTYGHPARAPFCSLSVLRFRGCLQTTSKLAIIIMSSCSKLWQWKT
jgi:hypothetical protein